VRLEPLDIEVGGWTRRSTVVHLIGGGHEGTGEDVTYEGGDQIAFRKSGPGFDPRGRQTLDEFCRGLDDFALFSKPQGGAVARRYRRWAFESAALDLALRQAGLSLADALDRALSPVTFVLSGGLGNPPNSNPLTRQLERYPESRFKLDFSTAWTPALVAELHDLGVVDVVDLKGLYRGKFTGPEADPGLYREVATGLADAWIEDPELNRATFDSLASHLDRVTWDVPLHSVADIALLPFKPRMINVKPSRFGSLAELFAVYEYCRGHDIGMYGCGQFELGPGRAHLQYLAGLFHPDAPNDVAPTGYHSPNPASGLPTSPMVLEPSSIGFRA